jgi:hypothetical protein
MFAAKMLPNVFPPLTQGENDAARKNGVALRTAWVLQQFLIKVRIPRCVVQWRNMVKRTCWRAAVNARVCQCTSSFVLALNKPLICASVA